MATNNGYSGTLVPRIGYTRSVCFRNRVRRSFGQSGAVLGVFLYLIFAVPGNGYLTTGYTRSWLFPKKILREPIPSRAACFRKEGAERSGPGTGPGSRGYSKPNWTSFRSPMMSREERHGSCRKISTRSVHPRQNGLAWPLIIPSSFQYACPGAQVRAGLKHQKKRKC